MSELTKPRETLHQQGSHVVQPQQHVKSVPASVSVESLRANLYRGVALDVKALTDEDKSAFRAALEADSKAETIFKNPVREKQREVVRKLLG